MRRHSTDMLALLFGLAFGATGAAFLVNELTDNEMDAAWVSAIAFVLLGVIALSVTLLRRPPEHDLEPEIDRAEQS